ncbi:Hypothetical protein NCS54_01184200 [Fusarium falciforme]|uniref:Hypothetical protein n=1 Tax=Fusarium falciforme TaxID=195108 RepID=UPI002301C451|nr:Hypothetical protein NCS54_01184200 [Fusarium falciforme]WAO94267.1 Hypothetical protein NCS54_01184200 [Fusarium falciforme]
MAEHLEHRAWSSMFYPGDFAMPWVGKTPTIDERRRYMAAYLARMIPCVGKKPGDYEQELRQSAQKKVVAKYVADGTASMRDGTFEYLVDLGKMHPNMPKWPWTPPAEDPEGKTSSTFATLTSDNEVKAMATRWLAKRGRETPPNESSEQSDLSNLFLVFAQRSSEPTGCQSRQW